MQPSPLRSPAALPALFGAALRQAGAEFGHLLHGWVTVRLGDCATGWLRD
ncbi:hypothetical protein [Deinococcus sp.]|nr:hypothetical protein [Deinococcus sp.]